jgi:hypothetical protein
MERKKSKLKLNKRRVIVLIVLAIICVLLLIGLVNLIKLIFAKEEVAGNLANMGLAVSEGNLTFYNKYEEGIVKIKGGEEYQITEETAYSIHLEDDTVYYLTLSNSNTLDLKSVKTNGDQPKKIKTLSTPSSKFYVEDNYIYQKDLVRKLWMEHLIKPNSVIVGDADENKKVTCKGGLLIPASTIASSFDVKTIEKYAEAPNALLNKFIEKSKLNTLKRLDVIIEQHSNLEDEKDNLDLAEILYNN